MVWDFSDRPRTNVLWVGQSIPLETELFLKRLLFSTIDSSFVSNLKDEGFLRSVAAVIFVQDESNPNAVISNLKQHVNNLLDYDCLVIVLAASKVKDTAVNNLAVITDALLNHNIPSLWPTSGDQFEGYDGQSKPYKSNMRGAPKPPLVFVYRDSLSVDIIANKLVSHNQRPVPAMDEPISFKMTGPGIGELKPEHRLMIRRSFHDCNEIHLSSLSGGQSGMHVYIAHATINEGRPLPYFVKVGSRNEIIREWLNYNEHVRPFVPFHLAPHLVPERCALGAHTGIIVGDYIEDAESLGECARSGRAITPISSLFDRTLRGWHRKLEEKSGTLNGVLGKLTLDRWGKFDPRYLRAKSLGAKFTLDELNAKLKQRGPELQVWSRIHGDLHADNVRVRGGEAILIDFLAGREGLLLGDHAALEVSLAIRVPRADIDNKLSNEEWERVVRPLYKLDALRTLPSFPDPTEPYSWLAACIRQIRLYALPMEKIKGQYAHILAYYLLRAAIKDPLPKVLANEPLPKELVDEDYRRTIAYCLAEDLILNASPKQ